jgi:hypothetical protein
VEAVAERMGDHVVGHHPTMPGVGKTAQAVVATRRLEDGLHAFMMTNSVGYAPGAGRGVQHEFRKEH